MKRIIIMFLFASTLVLASSKIAIAIKVKGNVSVIQDGTTGKQKLVPGAALKDLDKILTGKGGFVAIMYLDDKTVIKLLANSDLTIAGKRSGSRINKSLDIKYGKLSSKITPQKGNEFRISTPTSVASVKGTELTISSDPSKGDSFTLIEGSVEVTNTIMGESTEVKEGETAISTPEGSLEVHVTTSDDMVGFEAADVEIPAKELRFEIEDEDGNIKEIIIKFN